MASLDAPDVPKWSPRISKWRHQAPQMATPSSQKGPAAEGVPLKIKRKMRNEKKDEKNKTKQHNNNKSKKRTRNKKIIRNIIRRR